MMAGWTSLAQGMDGSAYDWLFRVNLRLLSRRRLLLCSLSMKTRSTEPAGCETSDVHSRNTGAVAEQHPAVVAIDPYHISGQGRSGRRCRIANRDCSHAQPDSRSDVVPGRTHGKSPIRLSRSTRGPLDVHAGLILSAVDCLSRWSQVANVDGPWRLKHFVCGVVHSRLKSRRNLCTWEPFTSQRVGKPTAPCTSDIVPASPRPLL